MAKTQNEQVKVQEKNQDSHLLQTSSLQSEIQQDQFGLSSQLTHAAIFPEQAKPETIQLLQERYGNNEVRRIVQPQLLQEPVVDQSRTLDKQIVDEIQRARGGGQPLESEISSQATQKFGKSLDNVRVHTDRKSDQISRQINARAFTIGNDIFFRSGAYSPNSEHGKQTLLHELTHVVQQSSSGTSSGPLKLGEPDDQYEREADHISQSESKAGQSGVALTKGVVQRRFMDGIKRKVGGVFNRGGSTTTNPTAGPAVGAAPNSSPTATPTRPASMNADDWSRLQEAGITDLADWNSLQQGEKNILVKLLLSNSPVLRNLIDAKHNGKWPNDDVGQPIYDIKKIPLIIEKFHLDFESWSIINRSHRKLLFDLQEKSYVSKLARLSKEGKWPKDGNDGDISNEIVFDTIIDQLEMDLSGWGLIKDKKQRAFLLTNSDKSYIIELKGAALRQDWPKDGNDDFIDDDRTFKTITKDLGLDIRSWLKIKEQNRREFLLKPRGALSKENHQELASSAVSGIWPKDGSDQDISDNNDWKKIKDSFPVMTPSNWNGLDILARRDALAESDITKRKNIINSANYQSKSKETKLEKAGGIASHPAFDLVSGTLGTTSGIIGASKGTDENAGLDRASGIVGATGDVLNMGTSTTQLIGSASKISRGKKMANDPNASLAMKALGRKEMTKGKWGVAQSTFGLAGSTASFGGNLTKSIDPELKGAKDTTAGFGVASGILGMIGSGLGLGKGSASMHSARKRSGLAKSFVKTAAKGQTLSTEEQNMNDIAQFTSKNQNKTGKGFGIFKSVSSFLGSAVTTIGSIGSLAGLSNEAGLGLGITGAALSGIGVLGGIGQWAAESKGKPQETDLQDKAVKLISLLRLRDSNGKEAAKFVQTVLKIDLVKENDPDTWSNWIDEDEEAAKALIKSKLSKF